MSSFAQQLIAGLHEAAAGDFTRFTIQGQVWVRHDAGSPEHQLSEARSAIADMTTEIDVLRSERAAALEALKPFVDAFGRAQARIEHAETAAGYWLIELSVTMSDCRRARAALEKKGVPNE